MTKQQQSPAVRNSPVPNAVFSSWTQPPAPPTSSSKGSSTWSDNTTITEQRPSWSDEWKSLGLGATLREGPPFPPNLFFVQLGFGVDQHGKDQDATKAAVRAVRNAIEFNSIPGVISHIPGGRANMLIHVKLGVPVTLTKDSSSSSNDDGPPLPVVDVLQVAKVFPYGQLLPIEITTGGIAFHTGRIVQELGDTNDVGICVVACVSLGYSDKNDDNASGRNGTHHTTYNTKDGY